MTTNETQPSPSGATSSSAGPSAAGSSAAKARPSRLRYVPLALLIVVAAVGFAAVSFYGSEIQAFWSLRGWNKGAAGQVAVRFSEAVQKQQADAALALVDRKSYEPLSKGGKVVGLQKVDPSGMGRYKLDFKGYIPPGNVTVQSIYMTTEEEGRFVVSLKFGDGKTGDFLVRRADDGYKIAAVPLSIR